jgi:hypothetical protein
VLASIQPESVHWPLSPSLPVQTRNRYCRVAESGSEDEAVSVGVSDASVAPLAGDSSVAAAGGWLE